MTEIPARLSSALTGQYTFERPLGEGGMATVYLARDEKHNRPVAIKVLKPELSAVLGGDRFLNEITLTANLQHPHILQLYDSGEARVPPLRDAERGTGGEVLLYYVMPYVEGESLRDRLAREGQLPIDDAVAIAKAVAGALDYAHKRDVIHRDIKPENILLHDGVALLADFGIALAVKAAGGERLTDTGLSIGTPAYMSPEQVAGERTLDARSDVYALACVMYEMLAGDPPFVASSAQAVMAKHVTDTPPPITTTRPSVSPAMARALATALQKSPADRYASAASFVEAFVADEEFPEPEAKQPKSIVVLPFTNASPDPDHEYFADGLTEEVIGDLTGLTGLMAISRNSSMALKGTTKSTRAIAEELGVSHIVTGSARRVGDAVRVVAELVDAGTDRPVWSEKYSGTLADVFGIQEEIARKIVTALEVTLTAPENDRIGRRDIDDVAAYDCYQRARHEVWRSSAGLDRAKQLVESAIQMVGDNELLLATLGQIHFQRVHAGLATDDTELAEAESCLTRIFAMNPESAPGHTLRAAISYKKGLLQEVVRSSRRALASDPDDAEALFWLTTMHGTCGANAEGRALGDRLMALDPLNASNHWSRAWVEFTAGEFEDAVAISKRGRDIDPDNITIMWGHVAHLAGSGRIEEACAEIDRLDSSNSELPWGRSFALYKAALRGETEKGLAYRDADFLPYLWDDEYGSWQAAGAFAMLGDLTEALRWLEHATLERGFVNYPFLSERDPFLENLRTDARFHDLMGQVKKRWQEFEFD